MIAICKKASHGIKIFFKKHIFTGVCEHES